MGRNGSRRQRATSKGGAPRSSVIEVWMLPVSGREAAQGALATGLARFGKLKGCYFLLRNGDVYWMPENDAIADLNDVIRHYYDLMREGS